MRLRLSLLLCTGAKGIREISSNTSPCGSLSDYLEANHDQVLPDSTNFPVDNYKIKYKQNSKGNDLGSVYCRRPKKSSSTEDFNAYNAWKSSQDRMDRKGRFKCKDGQWHKKSDVLFCPDKQTIGSWISHSQRKLHDYKRVYWNFDEFSTVTSEVGSVSGFTDKASFFDNAATVCDNHSNFDCIGYSYDNTITDFSSGSIAVTLYADDIEGHTTAAESSLIILMMQKQFLADLGLRHPLGSIDD